MAFEFGDKITSYELHSVYFPVIYDPYARF